MPLRASPNKLSQHNATVAYSIFNFGIWRLTVVLPLDAHYHLLNMSLFSLLALRGNKIQFNSIQRDKEYKNHDAGAIMGYLKASKKGPFSKK